MKYSRVYVDAIGYELAPVVVTSAEIEQRLAPLYETLKIPAGQLEAWTGISERRWWPVGYGLSDGATEDKVQTAAEVSTLVWLNRRKRFSSVAATLAGSDLALP